MDGYSQCFGKMMVHQEEVNRGIKELLIQRHWIAGNDVEREIMEHYLSVYNIPYYCDYDNNYIELEVVKRD